MTALLLPETESNALAFLAMGNPEPGTERFAKRCRVLLKKLSQESDFLQSIQQELDGELALDVSLPHPNQPLVERNGHREFRSNRLVQRIVRHSAWKHSPFLARFSVSDRRQLAQLLGLRLNVFVTLPFVTNGLFRRLATTSSQQATALPSQPLQLKNGQLCFQPNHLVAFLFKESGWTLQELQAFPGEEEDWGQLVQLLGSPVAGVGCGS